MWFECKGLPSDRLPSFITGSTNMPMRTHTDCLQREGLQQEGARSWFIHEVCPVWGIMPLWGVYKYMPKSSNRHRVVRSACRARWRDVFLPRALQSQRTDSWKEDLYNHELRSQWAVCFEKDDLPEIGEKVPTRSGTKAVSWLAHQSLFQM